MKCKEMALVLICAYLIAAAVNFEGFFWGDDPENCVQIGATVCYAAVSICYLIYARKRQNCVIFSALGGGGLMLAGSFAVLARSCCDIFAVPGALFATAFVTPLYGVKSVFYDWDTFYGVLAVVGGVWLGVSLLFFCCNRKNVKREES